MSTESFDISVSTDAGMAERTERGFLPRRDVLTLALALGLVLCAVAWAVGTRALLARTSRATALRAVSRAEQGFRNGQSDRAERLRSSVRLISEDPRLKSVIATRGMDAATIQDVLSDLRRLAGVSVIAVLGTDGKLRAAAADPSLQVRNPSPPLGERHADEGSTLGVLGGKVATWSWRSLRIGEEEFGVLVLGDVIAPGVFTGLHAQTGVSAAILSQGVTGTGAGPLQEAATALGRGERPEPLRIRMLGGTAAAAQVTELGEGAARTWLAYALSVTDAAAPYDFATWLVWGPVGAAVVLGLIGMWRGRLLGGVS